MKVLVTGATGYIGGRLVPRLLERGFQVRCMTRDVTRTFKVGAGIFSARDNRAGYQQQG